MPTGRQAELAEEMGAMERPVVGPSFWPWLLQRVTAVGLIVLLPIHIVVNHLFNIAEVESGALPGLVVFSDVAERIETPTYWVIDILLLSFALYHGLNGVRNVALDYGLRGAAEKALTGALSVLGLVAFGFGVVVLASFID
jgi:succinate dehydrogenase / fumarate reductase membrane anchor subunit